MKKNKTNLIREVGKTMFKASPKPFKCPYCKNQSKAKRYATEKALNQHISGRHSHDTLLAHKGLIPQNFFVLRRMVL